MQQPCRTTGAQQQQSKNKMINTRTTLFTLSQVQKTYDFGNIENCEQIIDITLIYCSLISILSCTMCVEIHTEGPLLSCRNMYLCTYCLLLLPLLKEIFHFKGRLIDNVVGFSIVPAAGNGTLTHHVYVSLISSQIKTVSKTCDFRLAQYRLALLNSPQEEAYEHLFEKLLVI